MPHLQEKLHRKFDLVFSLGKCAGAFFINLINSHQPVQNVTCNTFSSLSRFTFTVVVSPFLNAERPFM